MADGLEKLENQEEVDPWLKAFEALEKPAAEGTEPGEPEEDAGADGGQEQPDDTGAGADGVPGDQLERHDSPDGLDNPEDGNQVDPTPGEVAPDVDEAIKEYQGQARQAAIDTVVEAYKKQGVRCTPDGKLGASLSDPDICKKDADGTIRYYNPENGREFTGPNPRRDAQDYCDQYNRELAEQFNKACAKVEQQKMQEYDPAIRVLKFAPKYDALDDMTRGMLDDLIEDYEVKDSDGNLIGYSCDLDAALKTVQKQMARFKDYTKPEPKPATGPEEDMKKGSAKGNSDPEKHFVPKSLEEAMEYIQNREAEEAKNKKKGRK